MEKRAPKEPRKVLEGILKLGRKEPQMAMGFEGTWLRERYQSLQCLGNFHVCVVGRAVGLLGVTHPPGGLAEG